MGLFPAGSFSNRNFCAHQIHHSRAIDPMLLDVLADAQTSGGLLISLPEARGAALVRDLREGGVFHAAVIGRAMAADAGSIVLA